MHSVARPRLEVRVSRRSRNVRGPRDAKSIFRRQMLIPLSVVCLLLLAVPEGSAGADGTPPSATSFSATPSTVTSGSLLTMQWEVVSPAGVADTYDWAQMPNSDSNLMACSGNPATLVSGTDTDGGYQETCTVPTDAPNGTYTVQVQTEDTLGQVVEEPVGSFTVTGGTGAAPPSVVGTPLPLVVSKTSEAVDSSTAISIPLRCVQQTCRGTLTVEAPSTTAGTSSHRIGLIRRTRWTVLGRAALSMKRGQRRALVVRLNDVGRRMIVAAHGRALHLSMVESLKGRTSIRRNIVVG